MHYITEYEHEEAHDNIFLELARLNFNLVRTLHLKELKALSLWWRDLYDTVKLPCAQDRMVEIYFWTCGMLHEEEYSHARMFFAKTFGMVSLLDDTFDVHATLEECQYLHTLYIKTLRNFDEFEDSLEPNKKYRMSYAKQAYKLSSQNYLREAIWSREKYQPSFKEHEEVSIMSSGLPMLTNITLLGYGDAATQDVFEWLGKHKKDMTSAVETYMIENGLTGEEALAEIAALLENRWRILNQTSMDIDRSLLPGEQVVVNMARTNEIIYLHGRDACTFGDDLKDLVTTLFLKLVPL
nr:unnamed protein product [Digitaria exilis]